MAIVLASSLAAADPVPQPRTLEEAAALPDATIHRNPDGSGALWQVSVRRDGIAYTWSMQGGRLQTLEQDVTGLGAVGCLFIVYNEIRSLLTACMPGQYPIMEDGLDYALGEITGFIVENPPSSQPLSRGDVEAAALERRERNLARFLPLPPERREPACASMMGMMHLFARRSTEEWRSSTRELLAVRRRTVMNPCI